MHFLSTSLSFAATLSAVAAQYKGFNYGSTLTDGSAKDQAYFESEFAAAKVLAGTTGFTSARLYTMIQAGTTNTPIAAIPAAIAQDTSLLLGLWASGGQTGLTNEIAALTAAISQYGTNFTSRVIGISVGSEDLYRDSATGIAAMAGVGTTPDVIVNFIQQVKSALSSTTLSSAKITHVDTYNAWTNGSNAAVIEAVDFLSMDAYPYYQSTMPNSIADGTGLFQTAYDATVAVASGKDVWVTETGWPVSGADEGAAVASVANAQTYWDDVGCDMLFGKVNTFWYILQDAIPTLPSPSFGLVGVGSVDQAPLFNLTCPAVSGSAIVAADSASASSSAAASGATSSSASPSSPSSSSSVASAGRAPLTVASSSPSSAATAFAASSKASGVAAQSAAASSAVTTNHSGSVVASTSSIKTSTKSSSTTTTASSSAAAVPATISGGERIPATITVSLAGLMSILALWAL